MAPRTGEKEIQSLVTALETHPDSLVFARLADAYRKDGNISQAIELCTNGINKYPDYTTGRILLGRCYLEQQQLEQAASEFSEVCSFDRRNHVAIKMLADIYVQQERTDKAGDLYAILKSMDPDNPTLQHLCMQYPSTNNSDLLSIIGMTPDYQRGATSSPAENTMPEQTTMEPGFEEPPLEEDTLTQDTFESTLPDGLSGPATSPSDAVTGSDISDRMSALFGEQEETSDSGATLNQEESDLASAGDIESVIAEITSDSSDSSDVSGSDVSDRIEELFTENGATSPTQSSSAEEDSLFSENTPPAENPDLSLSEQDFDLSDLSSEPEPAQLENFVDSTELSAPENNGAFTEESLAIDADALSLENQDNASDIPSPDFDADIVSITDDDSSDKEALTGDDFAEKLDNLFSESDDTSEEDGIFQQFDIPGITDNNAEFPGTEQPAPAVEETMDESPTQDTFDDSVVSGDDVSTKLENLFSESGNIPGVEETGQQIEIPDVTDNNTESPVAEQPALSVEETIDENPAQNTPHDSIVSGDDVSEKLENLFSESDSVHSVEEADQQIEIPDVTDKVPFDDDTLMPFEEQTVIIKKSDEESGIQPLPPIQSEANDQSELHNVDILPELEPTANTTPDSSQPPTGEDVADQFDSLFPDDATHTVPDSIEEPKENTFEQPSEAGMTPTEEDVADTSEASSADILPELELTADSISDSSQPPTGEDVADQFDSLFPDDATHTVPDSIEEPKENTFEQPSEAGMTPTEEDVADTSEASSADILPELELTADSISDSSQPPTGEDVADQFDSLFPDDATHTVPDSTVESNEEVPEQSARIVMSPTSDDVADQFDTLFPEDPSLQKQSDLFRTAPEMQPPPTEHTDPSNTGTSAKQEDDLSGTDIINRINDIFETSPDQASHTADNSGSGDLFFSPPLLDNESPTETSPTPSATEDESLLFAPAPQQQDESILEKSSPDEQPYAHRDGSETTFDQLLPKDEDSSTMSSLSSIKDVPSFDNDADNTEEELFTPPAFEETLQFDSDMFEKMLNPEENEKTSPEQTAQNKADERTDTSFSTETPLQNSAEEPELVEFESSTDSSPDKNIPESVDILDTGTITFELQENRPEQPEDELVLDSTATFEVSDIFPEKEPSQLSLITEPDTEDSEKSEVDSIDLAELITDDSSFIDRSSFSNQVVSDNTEALDSTPSGEDVADKLNTLFSEDASDIPEKEQKRSSPTDPVVDLTKEYLLDDIAEIQNTEEDEGNDTALVETMQFTEDMFGDNTDSAELLQDTVQERTTEEPPQNSTVTPEDTPISGDDIKERLNDFFPEDDLMSLSGGTDTLQTEDEDQEPESNVSDFYTISGEDAMTSSDEDVPETLDNVEFVDESETSASKTPEEETSSEPDIIEEPENNHPEKKTLKSDSELEFVEKNDDLFDEYPAETVEMSQEEVASATTQPDNRDTPFNIPAHVLTPTLADIYFQQGQYPLAKQVFAKLLSQDPDNPKLLSRYNEIKSILEAEEISGTTEQSIPQRQRKTETTPRKTIARSSKVKSGLSDTRPLAGVKIKKKVKEARKKARKKSDPSK